MSMFFVKDGAPFVPEGINPDLAKMAKAIIKTCHLSLKAQMKTNGLNNAIKGGDPAQMKETALKCIEKNRPGYNSDMSLTGVRVEETDDSFFEDKDADFWAKLLAVLVDMGNIRTIVDARMLPLLGATCEKMLDKKLNEMTFFVNQTEVLSTDDGEEDEASAEE